MKTKLLLISGIMIIATFFSISHSAEATGPLAKIRRPNLLNRPDISTSTPTTTPPAWGNLRAELQHRRLNTIKERADAFSELWTKRLEKTFSNLVNLVKRVETTVNKIELTNKTVDLTTVKQHLTEAQKNITQGQTELDKLPEKISATIANNPAKGLPIDDLRVASQEVINYSLQAKQQITEAIRLLRSQTATSSSDTNQ